MPETEIWYVIEYSETGANDWFRQSAKTYDSLESALKACKNLRKAHYQRKYDFRVVRQTVVSEVENV